MNSGIISMRYARALFEYAIESKVEDTLFTEMKNVSMAFENNKELRTVLDNPVLDEESKLQIIKTAAGGNPSEAFVNFAHLLLQRKRENHLQSVSLIYVDLYRKHKNINLGKLVTAAPVTPEVVEKMKTILQARQSGTLEFETKVDPDIEGGFVLYIDTYRLDASVASQLRNIRKQLAR